MVVPPVLFANVVAACLACSPPEYSTVPTLFTALDILSATSANPAPAPPVLTAVASIPAPETIDATPAVALPASITPVMAPKPAPIRPSVAAPMPIPAHMLSPFFAAVIPPMIDPTTAPIAAVIRKNGRSPVVSDIFIGLLRQYANRLFPRVDFD